MRWLRSCSTAKTTRRATSRVPHPCRALRERVGTTLLGTTLFVASVGNPAYAGGPSFRVLCVQSHDILYTLSRDILYTPARFARREVGAGWHGRRWMFRNSGFGLWWRRRSTRGLLKRCVPRMRFRGPRDICGWSVTGSREWPGLRSRAANHITVRGGRAANWSGRWWSCGCGLGCPQIAGGVGARRYRVAAQYDSSHPAAPRFSAGGGTTLPGRATLRARPAQSVVADGFQRAEGMAAAGRAAVGAGRSQPLPDCPGGQRQHAPRTGATPVGRSLSALWRSRRHADGPRYPVVEHAGGCGPDASAGHFPESGCRWSRSNIA
jgi:hypothetical protein